VLETLKEKISEIHRMKQRCQILTVKLSIVRIAVLWNVFLKNMGQGNHIKGKQ